VKYTYDGTYLVSGSDDTNLRLWKSKASEQLGVVSFLMALTACKLVLCLAMFVTCFCSGALLISGGSLFYFGKFTRHLASFSVIRLWIPICLH